MASENNFLESLRTVNSCSHIQAILCQPVPKSFLITDGTCPFYDPRHLSGVGFQGQWSLAPTWNYTVCLAQSFLRVGSSVTVLPSNTFWAPTWCWALLNSRNNWLKREKQSKILFWPWKNVLTQRSSIFLFWSNSYSPLNPQTLKLISILL